MVDRDELLSDEDMLEELSEFTWFFDLVDNFPSFSDIAAHWPTLIRVRRWSF
jgi:hypothetical protein